MRIRRMDAADLASVLSVQSESPGISQWSRSDYETSLRNEVAGWIAEDDGRVVGFIVARLAAQEIEILNLAVRPASRRQGVGTELLNAALQWGRASGAERAILDVRASNRPALRLYERHGFHIEGRRPRYYRSPAEDALLLGCSLNSGAQDQGAAKANFANAKERSA
ncbi:MAG TPA: ribosomal protein S18-alanine N-acetyltransferase [Candidatus Acidoferrales bacterium]|nr:ribosomal protein S18-alanine N-acetyltransferase [Candidatus Acidoferrales bacterium]